MCDQDPSSGLPAVVGRVKIHSNLNCHVQSALLLLLFLIQFYTVPHDCKSKGSDDRRIPLGQLGTASQLVLQLCNKYTTVPVLKAILVTKR